MGPFMKVPGKWACDMVQVGSFSSMGIATLVNGKTTLCAAKENLKMRKVILLTATGSMISWMDSVSKFGRQTTPDMKGISLKDRNTAKGSTAGLMEVITKGLSRMV